MYGSMVDIQSAAAEIRRGNKKDRRKKPQGKNIMSASATQGGHKKYRKSNSEADEKQKATDKTEELIVYTVKNFLVSVYNGNWTTRGLPTRGLANSRTPPTGVVVLIA